MKKTTLSILFLSAVFHANLMSAPLRGPVNAFRRSLISGRNPLKQFSNSVKAEAAESSKSDMQRLEEKLDEVRESTRTINVITGGILGFSIMNAFGMNFK